MTHKLCEIYKSLEEKGVQVFSCPLKNNVAISSPEGLIGINESLLTTQAELTSVLAHEDGHFISGAFYLPFSQYVIREQAEYKANKAAIMRYIPKIEIEACLNNGKCELWELAEHFNVTEAFMLSAILLYKEQAQAGA